MSKVPDDTNCAKNVYWSRCNFPCLSKAEARSKSKDGKGSIEADGEYHPGELPPDKIFFKCTLFATCAGEAENHDSGKLQPRSANSECRSTSLKECTLPNTSLSINLPQTVAGAKVQFLLVSTPLFTLWTPSSVN